MDAFLARGYERGAIENGIHKILNENRVRVSGVFEGNFHVPDFRLRETDFGSFAELEHVSLVARERELVMFEDHLAACAGDFETVGAWRFAGGGDKHAGRCAGILE